jgi:luciferase family oxidoreductase group 1
VTSPALSVLDLVPVRQGQTSGQALAATRSLARVADDLGFRRYWLAEHHNMPAVAATNPPVLIAIVAGATERIRVGSGGVMLPNHAPLVIAEQFGTLEALYPGRIDLGLGRAPGTDQAAAHAMRRNLASDENQFPQDVLELVGYFKGENGRVRAIPGEGAQIPIWILGSSLFGAQLAAMLGLPYAFASHFAPQMMMDAIRVYRERFEPSDQLDRPYVILGYNVFAADSDEQAQLLATSVQQAFVALRTGRASQLPPPQAGFADTLPPQGRALLDSLLSCSAIGTPATVRRQVEAFVERTGADELMVTSQIHDHQARIHSYELLMDCVR